MKNGLVWFKNDLRLHDNEALCMAIANCNTLVLCYCIEDSLFKELKLGFRKADINRFKFLEQSLQNLQKNAESIGGHLIICSGKAEVEISKLVDKFSISEIYAEQEYASEELDLLDRVKEHCDQVEFRLFWGKTLYHIDDIPFKINEIPLTSKAYRIPVSKQTEPRQPFLIPEHISSHPKASSNNIPSYKAFGFTTAAYDSATPFVEGGEKNGLQRLQYYTFDTEQLTSYRWTRNRSMGMDYSSKFSPYLALGCLSPREIYRVVKEYESKIKKNQSTWWMIFELVWRDYFTFKGMRFGDQIFKTEGFKKKVLKFENDSELWKTWMRGKTGIPFVDASMRQLNTTGFMSNRGRVNCSSHLIHDLKIDWTWGAAYFESRLIDYDVSANWLNWHVQAYEIWYTNPIHQSNKYKVQDFIREWIPELKELDDTDILIPWLVENLNYPKPKELFSKWARSINKILMD